MNLDLIISVPMVMVLFFSSGGYLTITFAAGRDFACHKQQPYQSNAFSQSP